MAIKVNILFIMPSLAVSQISWELANRLRECRVRQGLTQEQVSERADVPLSTYKRFEQKGLISLDGFIKVAIALGLEGALHSLFLPSESETEFESLDDVERAFASPKKVLPRARRRT
ncbi:MAG: helix-turn-helix domain-containing protein [Verrucomicrobia bacterium]|jgi:transcriptional regulator with XRE-family HTH domain|nr:helix-turn-helix domain-containing protein [Verrucomicrobiota bacterium]